jgi:hypothetical protein
MSELFPLGQIVAPNSSNTSFDKKPSANCAINWRTLLRRSEKLAVRRLPLWSRRQLLLLRPTSGVSAHRMRAMDKTQELSLTPSAKWA